MTNVTSPSHAREASSHIRNSVDWETTPEGFDFWAAVTERLRLWGLGNDCEEHLLIEHNVKVPGAAIAPLRKALSLGTSGVVDLEKQPLVVNLREQVALQNDEIHRLLEIISAFDQERKKFRARLLAADFATMGRT